MSIPIICRGCGRTGSVNRVTASLACGYCKTGDHLDVNDNVKTAAPHGPGTGWNTPRPDSLSGWDEYVGPPVGRNPLNSDQMVNDSQMCPACGGTGRDARASGGGYDENSCRLCGGTGKYNPPTSQGGDYLHPETFDKRVKQPASGGAALQGARSSLDTNYKIVPSKTAVAYPVQVTYSNGTTWTVPGADFTNFTTTAGRPSSDPLGSPEQYVSDAYNKNAPPAEKPTGHGDKPLDLKTQCPTCNYSNTVLARDASDNAWWACPKCGPLANVDKNPDVNPYSPPIGFKPDRSMKTKALFNRKKNGKVLKVVHAVLENNPGVTTAEALTLSRKALIKFQEDQS